MEKISDIRIDAFIREANAYIHHINDHNIPTNDPEYISWFGIKLDNYLSSHRILVDYEFNIVSLSEIHFRVRSKSVWSSFIIDTTKDLSKSITKK